MTDIEDRVLVKSFLLTRSETIFRQLYRRHTAAIYRMALHLCDKNIQVAEDIVQETWLRAVSSLDCFQWRSSFRTWLWGIALNCSREYNRKNKTSGPPPNEITDGPERQDMKIDINNALATMSPGYREILILHDLEGFRHHEIGILLEISEGTSKSQLHHARKALQRILN